MSSDPSFEILILSRLAVAQERLERWEEAAKTYERAAAFPEVPNRDRIQADAARCYAEAGMREEAKSLYNEIAERGGMESLPTHLRTRLREVGS